MVNKIHDKLFLLSTLIDWFSDNKEFLNKSEIPFKTRVEQLLIKKEKEILKATGSKGSVHEMV